MEKQIKYKAVVYIRLSNVDDKPGESDSVANQRKLIDEYLKNHPELEAVNEFVDDGVSGIVFDRPSFNAMMEPHYAESRYHISVQPPFKSGITQKVRNHE